MRNFTTIIRSCLLYIMALVAATAYPLTALASTDPLPAENTVVETTVAPQETTTPSPDASQTNTTSGQEGATTGTSEQAPAAPTPSTAAETEAPTPAAATAQSESSVAPAAPATTQESAPVSSNSSTSSSPNASTNTTVNTAIDATNNLTSQAKTGDAGIIKNTTGGSATSGDAAATTTVINTVHSTVQGDTAGVAHFTADIHGNVVGDITLSPILSGVLANPNSAPLTTTVQTDQNSNLTNNISLNAQSGNADVIRNTTAGDATTGSADTVANIINLINTIIAANQSFVGTINIYGNLDGDILISPDFIPQLLASNAPNAAGSDATLSTLGVADTQSIINNVNLDAASGSANVLGNTTAGSATTGQAKTNLTILNYTGHEVVASNSLLVFVNVLGEWVGIIVDAPVGATAAVLGNGVTSNTASQAVNADTTSGITNNLDLTSRSGNATVEGNTTAGNATSGDATASANIANISTSVFSLSDWFGVLFINVFGKWYGSVGVNTANGDVVPLTDGLVPLANPPLITPTAAAAAAPASPKFGFVPRQSNVSFGGSASTEFEPVTAEPIAQVANALLDEVPELAVSKEKPAVAAATPGTSRPYTYLALMAVVSLIGATLMANDTFRRK